MLDPVQTKPGWVEGTEGFVSNVNRKLFNYGLFTLIECCSLILVVTDRKPYKCTFSCLSSNKESWPRASLSALSVKHIGQYPRVIYLIVYLIGNQAPFEGWAPDHIQSLFNIVCDLVS